MGWFFIFPVLLHVLIFYGGFVAISELNSIVLDYFDNFSNLENADFWGASVLAWLAGGLLWLIFRVLFFFIFAYFGGFIVIILLSPVLAIISEKTEKIATGNEFDSSPEQIVRDVIRGVLLALRNMAIEFGIVIIVFAVTITIGAIPVIGWTIALAGQAIVFLVSAYFYGFSFFDYAIERRKLNVKESSKLMKQNTGSAIGNGLPFALCMLVPFIGSITASFLAIVSTVAACLTVIELEEKGMTSLPQSS